MSESLPRLTETQRYSLVKKHQLKLVTVVDLAASAANGDFAFQEFRELREAFFTHEHPGLNKLISELQAKLGTKIEDGDAAFRALDGLPLPGYAVLFTGNRLKVRCDESQAWFYAKTLDEAWLLAADWEGALFDELTADPEEAKAPVQQAASAPTPADPAKSEHYTKLFMDACRGIDARDIAAAMALVTPATNWTNCPKSFIATRYGLVMAGKSVSLVTADFDGMRSLNLQALVDTARARAEEVMDWRKLYQPLNDEEPPTVAPLSAPAAPAAEVRGFDHYRHFMDSCWRVPAQDMAAVLALVAPSVSWKGLSKNRLADRYTLIMTGGETDIVEAEAARIRRLGAEALGRVASRRTADDSSWDAVLMQLVAERA